MTELENKQGLIHSYPSPVWVGWGSILVTGAFGQTSDAKDSKNIDK